MRVQWYKSIIRKEDMELIPSIMSVRLAPAELEADANITDSCEKRMETQAHNDRR